MSIPEVVGAAVVTEQVFSWPGVGLLMVQGVKDRDFFLIMGVTIVLAFVVLVVNLVVDIVSKRLLVNELLERPEANRALVDLKERRIRGAKVLRL